MKIVKHVCHHILGMDRESGNALNFATLKLRYCGLDFPTADPRTRASSIISSGNKRTVEVMT